MAIGPDSMEYKISMMEPSSVGLGGMYTICKALTKAQIEVPFWWFIWEDVALAQSQSFPMWKGEGSNCDLTLLLQLPAMLWTARIVCGAGVSCLESHCHTHKERAAGFQLLWAHPFQGMYDHSLCVLIILSYLCATINTVFEKGHCQ